MRMSIPRLLFFPKSKQYIVREGCTR
jgi:hypothetical protein